MTQQRKELDRVLTNLINRTAGIRDHFYSNIKGVLYLQIDDGQIVDNAITLQIGNIVSVANYYGIYAIIIMDLIPVDLIRDAELEFISLN